MKKIKLYGAIAFFIVITMAAYLYWNWTKPYYIPQIDRSLSAADYNLDFSKELNTETRVASKDIDSLKSSVISDPNNLVYSNALRLKMNEAAQTDEFIRFADGVKQTSSIRLQQALGYVDMLQSKDLGTAALGQKSAQSILILDEILQDNPIDVLAHYARGLNNLYWPKGLKRTEKAVQDLSFCLAVEQLFEREPLPLWPLIYIAYGDTLVKNGDIQAGRKVWKDGHAKYPDDGKLEQRSLASDEEAYEIVKRERGIDGFQRPDPSISDLSKLWSR